MISATTTGPAKAATGDCNMFSLDSFLLGFTACFLLLWAIGSMKDKDK